MAKMLADRICMLSEEKYTELAAQVKNSSNMENMRKVSKVRFIKCLSELILQLHHVVSRLNVGPGPVRLLYL